MLWKHCLFCRDCLWRERISIYSWRSPCFAGDALPCLTGDHSVASLAITLLALSMASDPHYLDAGPGLDV
jgi:hypothetical protein